MSDNTPYCRQASITDVVSFFVVNYVLHAVTVVLSPGASMSGRTNAAFWALIAPYKGVYSALRVIHYAAWTFDPLKRAARAGALCCVCKTERRNGQEVTFVSRTEEPQLEPIQLLKGVGATVHGYIRLPPGYDLVPLPDFVEVFPVEVEDPAIDYRRSRDTVSHKISSNYNVVKTLASIIQVMYASFTLYEASHAQFTDFGFTAGSLTVIPYMIMSFTNLAANLVCADYPSMYLVHTDLLDEAKDDGAMIDGTVGFVESFVKHDTQLHRKIFKFALRAIGVGLVALLFILIWLLTGFRSGPQTQFSEKVWIWTWLVMSTLFGLMMGVLERHTYTNQVQSLFREFKYLNHFKGFGWWLAPVWTVLRFLGLAAVVITPVGMFYSVGVQITNFGVCELI